MTVFGLGDLAFLGAAGGVAAYDTDAQAYMTAVETADGQALETAVRDAINAFVLGCKADGIWTAIKASCILAGARTLNGALVPLVGTAPTNNNFVSGDYNRKTGLIGNASTKYINSNFLDSAVAQSNISLSVFQSTARTGSNAEALAGILATSPSFSGTILQSRSGGATDGVGYCRSSSDNGPFAGNLTTASFLGVKRSNSDSYTFRINSANTTFSQASAAALGGNIYIFARNLGGTAQLPTNARIAFYSIGEALDLALLDARVTALINALAAAIP